MAAHFDVDVSYSQIAVFDPELENPFNDWADQHVAQGFSWRPYSVSFGTLEEGGKAAVSVRTSSEIAVADRSARAILVPFTIRTTDAVEIGSISDSRQLTISRGSYALLFETASDDEADMWIQFTFVKHEDPKPMILRADSQVTLQDYFLMEATPA
jgi:hypothetical protein